LHGNDNKCARIDSYAASFITASCLTGAT